jgi:hypothetical protein
MAASTALRHPGLPALRKIDPSSPKSALNERAATLPPKTKLPRARCTDIASPDKAKFNPYKPTKEQRGNVTK